MMGNEAHVVSEEDMPGHVRQDRAVQRRGQDILLRCCTETKIQCEILVNLYVVIARSYNYLPGRSQCH